ncbi:MAG: DUF4331 family protein [Gemmatimonadetes bacterium]|nr:DUF4331 family protein [Gemmatimonadota bacterium]
MRNSPHRSRAGLATGLAAVAVLGLTTVIGTALGSDHQDTPEVELSPRMDINDVYAFPGSSDDRIVLVLTTSSPITPAQSATAAFDPSLLYQLKINNNTDAVEDVVIQVTFEGTGQAQEVIVRGPVAPPATGTVNEIAKVPATVSGPINTVLGSTSGMQVYAGLRDDPFFLDLEQFFRIIPDRKPVSGPLSLLPSTPSATSFRAAGAAVDYLRGVNTLAIVIELPESELTAGGTPRLGIWGTISR